MRGRLSFSPPIPYIIENKHTKKTDTSRSVSVFVLCGAFSATAQEHDAFAPSEAVDCCCTLRCVVL